MERFDFDPTGAQAVEDRIDDFDPAGARPVRRINPMATAGRTLGASAIPVARSIGMAAASLTGAIGGEAARDRVFAAVDDITGSMRDYYEPAADEEFSTLGQVMGGVASMPIELVGGFGLQRGIDRAAEVVQRGGTLGEAGTAGGVTGAVNVGLNLLPVKAGGRVAQAVEGKMGGMLAGALTGAGINVPAQVAGTAAENLALPSGGDAGVVDRAGGAGVRPEFADLARDPLDKQDLAVGTGLAAAFGGAAGRVRGRGAAGSQPQRGGTSGDVVPASFDEAVQAGRLQPAELSDATGYLAPNGAFITRADWDGASDRVRAGWMKPSEATQALDELGQGEGQGESAIDAPAAEQAPARRGAEAQPEPEGLQAADAAPIDADVDPRVAGIERLPNGTSPETRQALPSRAEDLRLPQEPAAADGAPAREPSAREAELARLVEQASDPAVRKDLERQLGAERKQAADQRAGEEYLRLADETGDPQLRDELEAKARKLGAERQAIPVGEATELPLADEAGPVPVEVQAAEAEWRRQQGFGSLDAQAAQAVARAMDLDPAAVERAVAQHRRSPRVFEREINRIIEERKTHASESTTVVRGGQGLAAVAERSGDQAEAGAGRPGADGDAAPRTERTKADGAGRSAEEAVAADRQALASLQQRIGQQVDGLKLTLAPHRDRATTSAAKADSERAASAEVARKLFGKRLVYFTADRPLANGIFSSADPGRLFINADSTRPELAVLGHEMTHALRTDRPDLYADLNDGLRAILRNQDAHALRLNERRQARGLKPLEADSLNEEMLADIVGDHFADPTFWKALQREQPGVFRELAVRVREWIDETIKRIVDAGLKPFQTERYLADLREARRVVVKALGEYARGEASRPTADDRPTSIDTPAFKRWFGNSKVVDAAGRPLRMFHGTSRSEGGDAFTSFDTYASNYGLMGQGSYFTADAGIASEYTRKGRGNAPTVYPVYLAIKNPIDMDARADAGAWRRQFDGIEQHHEGGDTNESWFRAAEDMLHDQQLPAWEGAEVMQDGLRAMGFDGITHVGGGRVAKDSVKHRVFIAFDPEQIKSATGNRGTFDPGSADIRMSLDSRLAADRKLADMPDETRAELLSRKFFDRFNRVLKAQELAGMQAEDADIVMADRLYHGRVQHQGDRLERDFLEPLGKLLRAARKDGVTVRDADDYLMARHAPERNRVVAERNPKMPDGGSGLTNAQAREIVGSFTPTQRRHLDAVAKLVHRMNAEKLDSMVDAGLIPASTRDQLQRQYRHYVPLKTLDEEDAARGIGRGYELRATDIATALGRKSKAGSPIAASIMDASRTILRAEKARVDRVVWNFARTPEGAGFIRPYDAQNPPRAVMGRKLGPDGKVTDVVDPQKVQDLTLQLLVDGEPQRVFVPDELLRDQLRKVATANDPGPVLRAIGRGTGTIGRLLTEFNPAFTIPNGVRDAITVGMRAGAYGLSGAQVVAGIPSAWKAIVDHKRGRSTAAARRYEEFLQHGGKTGAYGIQGIEDTMHRLERAGAELGYADKRRSAGRKVLHVLGDVADVVSSANEVIEYASRFTLYRALRDKGESPKQAAAAAKEISVNFNRSGEYGRTLNSVLVFANAALQGLYGTIHYAKSAKVRRNMLGMVALGAATQMYNELAGGENEETGELNINSQSDGVADRNVVLLQPGERSGIKVPLPPEYAALYAIGRRLWRAASQGDVARESAGIVGAVLDGTLPVRLPEASNQALGAARAVVPTVVSPFADLFVNESFFGSPIVPERVFDSSPPPAHTISWRSTSEVAKATSELLNSATGGDEIEPGLAQKKLGPIVSPEGLEHLVKFYTGGLGATAMLTTNMVRGMADDKAHDPNKTPVLNRFLFVEPKSYITRRYGELEPDLGYAKERLKKGGQVDDPRLARALPEFEAAEREMRRLRRAMRGADEATLEDLRAQVKAEQARVIRAYNGQPLQAR